MFGFFCVYAVAGRQIATKAMIDISRKVIRIGQSLVRLGAEVGAGRRGSGAIPTGR
jgi:hypothetical protein